MRLLDLNWQMPHVMAILNVTPDSFSDGGQFYNQGKVDLSLAMKEAESLLAQGASVIDVGGESTKPGSAPVSVQEEIDRVLPVIEGIKKSLPIKVSLDSSKSAVMQAAAEVGVDLINDVCALSADGALSVCAKYKLPVILMAGYGVVSDSQEQNCAHQVKCYLEQRINACREAGIDLGNVIVDPGFGFGKGLKGNQQLMAELPGLQVLGVPVAVGLSRKRTISDLLGGRAPKDRMAGSLALAVLALKQGARLIRAHDVKVTKDALVVASHFIA